MRVWDIRLALVISAIIETEKTVSDSAEELHATAALKLTRAFSDGLRFCCGLRPCIVGTTGPGFGHRIHTIGSLVDRI